MSFVSPSCMGRNITIKLSKEWYLGIRHVTHALYMLHMTFVTYIIEREQAFENQAFKHPV